MLGFFHVFYKCFSTYYMCINKFLNILFKDQIKNWERKMDLKSEVFIIKYNYITLSNLQISFLQANIFFYAYTYGPSTTSFKKH